jgi:hypothetical protein
MATPQQTTKIHSNKSWPAGYQFNLPPHSWSLPVSAIEHEILPGKTRSGVINYGTSNISYNRRGRIWQYAPIADLIDSSDPSVSSKFAAWWSASKSVASASLSTPANIGNRIGNAIGAVRDAIDTTRGNPEGEKLNKARKDKDYGFQFVWNPNQYRASTGISSNVVPAATDALAFLNLFQGTGTVEFTLEINRVNDFACFKSNSSSNLAKYYGPTAGLGTPDYNALINDLRKRGTLADIEFLYKTVNGGNLKNSANQETSDIGIIIPTLVRVDIGPYTQIGIIQSLATTHTMFTQNMIPIQSSVTINLQVLSAYGFGNQDSSESTNVGGNPSSLSTQPK